MCSSVLVALAVAKLFGHLSRQLQLIHFPRMCWYVCGCAKTHMHTGRGPGGGGSIKSHINKCPFSILATFTGCDEQLLLWGEMVWGFMGSTLTLFSAVVTFPSSCPRVWTLDFSSKTSVGRLTLAFLCYRPVRGQCRQISSRWLCHPTTEMLPYSSYLIWYPWSLPLVTNLKMFCVLYDWHRI